MLHGNPLSNDELMHIGASLGADVPYCFDGGTQLAEGIGEILKPLSPMPNAYILLVKPPINYLRHLFTNKLTTHLSKFVPTQTE